MATQTQVEVGAEAFEAGKHDGTVTITSPSGGHRTFKLATVRRGKNAGVRRVYMLIGPDDWFCFGYVNGFGDVTPFRTLGGNDATFYVKVSRMLNRPAEYAAKGCGYLASLACRRCGRELTHPDSIADGLGPICREKD